MNDNSVESGCDYGYLIGKAKILFGIENVTGTTLDGASLKALEAYQRDSKKKKQEVSYKKDFNVIKTKWLKYINAKNDYFRIDGLVSKTNYWCIMHRMHLVGICMMYDELFGDIFKIVIEIIGDISGSIHDGK